MKLQVIYSFLVLGLLTSNCQEVADKTGDREAILQVMKQQEVDWNEGDIEGFMEGYWNSDSLLFVGNSGITQGYKATLERYIKNYDSREKMGTLHFEILSLSQVNEEVYFMTGRYNLSRSIGDATGIFTLVWKKIDGKWLIISDHTG